MEVNFNSKLRTQNSLLPSAFPSPQSPIPFFITKTPAYTDSPTPAFLAVPND